MGECDECPVCLDRIGASDICRTSCGHVFHSGCAFRAVRQDPRCSICRTRLVPEDEKPRSLPRETAIDIDGVDFVEFSARVRRERRNYNARRRRMETRDQSIKEMRDGWKAAEAELRVFDARLEQKYCSELRAVKNRPEVRAMCAELQRAVRREQRLKRVYNAQLEQRLGVCPPASPLEHLLMQDITDDS